ncbi:hypothetical protein QDG88_12970 [Pseudoalteromonas piscicida]|uniref:hypothetical protein n=1 Tax=Pseudoalteromonas piscicida TaxID=43662 RepID=UPI0027396205|nr:hypothetical protein [Pseudoalteromonas piscicida]MDP4488837.1 hypothetical protein [Pseudoalteromonas piscicida]
MKSTLQSVFALVSLFTATGSVAQCIMNEQGYANISGSYICTSVCQSEGKEAYVTQKGEKLLFINEALEKTPGVISKLEGTANNITFKVTNNCQQIEFSNGTVWLRK